MEHEYQGYGKERQYTKSFKARKENRANRLRNKRIKAKGNK